MRHRLLAILLMLGIVSAQAETSSMLELSVGGGWSSLGYRLSADQQPLLSLKQAGSYGLTGHFGYGLMFNCYVGLGVGVDVARYGSTAQLGGSVLWEDVTDTDGERYTHQTVIADWKDQQELYLLEVPLSVYLRAPLSNGKTWFSAVLGAKVGLPIIRGASYRGSLTHTAAYEPWQLVLKDVRGHGFYSSEMAADYALSARTSYAAFAKVGVETALDSKQKVFFFTHVYATYYFTEAVAVSDSPQDLGFRNDSSDPAMQQAHAFMSDYSSVLDTRLVSGKTRPIGVGVELGFRFRLAHPRRHTCHCVSD